MKKELRKTFRAGEDIYGFKSDIDIDVIYDTDSRTFELSKVQVYSQRYGCFIAITDAFKSPLFEPVINAIDWQGIYSKSLIDEASERAKIPYDVMMVTSALTSNQ